MKLWRPKEKHFWSQMKGGWKSERNGLHNWIRKETLTDIGKEISFCNKWILWIMLYSNVNK